MRVIDLRLASVAESVPYARHAMEDLTGLASQQSLDDARLLVSELVTNSIRHGHLSIDQDIQLRADVDGDTLHVEVCDPGGALELQPSIARTQLQDAGWGLFLVRLLAQRWGINADGSTLVWFDIPLRRGASDRPPP
jgi:anti-sigma regulatory factor (Ser/Thr protein kinase)